jgi:alkylation response protein AidB-like acyl-CoA dehydrogenase
VRVPVQNRVGEENRGWTYAKFLLGHERTNTAGIGNCKRVLTRLKQMAMTSSVGGRPMWADTRFRDRLARVELELTALEITNLRVLSAMSRGGAPGPEVSALKIKGSEIIQELVELQMHVLGPAAIASLPEVPTSGQYFNLRKTTIYAGSTEIQKNIIAKLVLGL